jgi:hypothetical protein
MILLFGDKATKTSSTRKNTNVKNNNPVENSGILAMGLSQAKSLLTIGEYDTYVFSNPTAVDYSMYSNSEFSTNEESGFMSNFSAAVAFLGGDCGFSTASYDCGSSSSSCSSFSSVG